MKFMTSFLGILFFTACGYWNCKTNVDSADTQNSFRILCVPVSSKLQCFLWKLMHLMPQNSFFFFFFSDVNCIRCISQMIQWNSKPCLKCKQT